VSLAEKLLEELRSDEKIRREIGRELAAILAEEVVKDRNVRLVMLRGLAKEVATRDDVTALRSDLEALRKEFRTEIEALRREAATKSDLEVLRRELREEVGRLESRVGSLEQRVGVLEQRVVRLEGSISFFIKLFIASNLPLLVSVIAALVTLLLKTPYR
jgi:hypothetical protein